MPSRRNHGSSYNAIENVRGRDTFAQVLSRAAAALDQLAELHEVELAAVRSEPRGATTAHPPASPDSQDRPCPTESAASVASSFSVQRTRRGNLPYGTQRRAKKRASRASRAPVASDPTDSCTTLDITTKPVSTRADLLGDLADDFQGILESFAGGGSPELIQEAVGSLLEVELAPEDCVDAFGFEACPESSSLRVAARDIQWTSSSARQDKGCGDEPALTFEQQPAAPLIKTGDRVMAVNGVSNDTAAMLEALGREDRVRLAVWSEQEYLVPFKDRIWTGKALHLVARHLDCTELLVEQLVAIRADVHEECRFVGPNSDTRLVQPLHVAAGVGNVPALCGLLCAEADPNAPARLLKKGEDAPEIHYTALHEAAFFDQASTVLELLRRDADILRRNVFGDTALHMAARQGAVSSARVLSGRNHLPELADQMHEMQMMKNREGLTPVVTAVELARFPYEKLYVLAFEKWDHILSVARLSPHAAKELLLNHGKSDMPQNLVAMPRSWSQLPEYGEKGGDQLSCWTELMRLSPWSASHLLEAVTNTPEVISPQFNALPTRCRLSENRWAMNVMYCEDGTWKPGEGFKRLPWQDALCPKAKPTRVSRLQNQLLNRKQPLVQVEVRVMRMPNVMRIEMLDAIARTKGSDSSIFAQFSTHAVIAISWRSIVRACCISFLTTRLAETCMLIACCVKPDMEPIVFRYIWSLLCVFVMRDVFFEMCLVRHLLKTKPPICILHRFFHVLTIVMMVLFLWQSSLQGEQGFMIGELKGSLAVVVFLRWLSLARTFGSFRLMGSWLLPIMRSFRPLGGIIIITIFVFVGLTIALLPLERADKEVMEFAALNYQLLFLGDTGSLSIAKTVAKTGALDDTTVLSLFFFVISTIGFSICLLNLFIAVHGESYDQAQESAEVDFMQTRAKMCANVFVQPFVPKETLDFGTRRGLNAIFIYVVAFAVWFALMLWPALEEATTLTSFILFLGQLLSDMTLRQRPWWNHDRCAMQPCARCKLNPAQVAENHLWICHRRDRMEVDVAIEENEASLQSASRGRFGNLKFHSALKMRKLGGEVGNIQSGLDEVFQKMKGHADHQLEMISSLRRPGVGSWLQAPLPSSDETLDKPAAPELFPAQQPWGSPAGRWRYVR